MKEDTKNLLITGPPGIGKTTLMMKIMDRLKDLRIAGFHTVEIRESGERKGFELVSLHGQRSVLSHVEIKGMRRVGKYGVDVGGFDEFLDRLALGTSEIDLVLIDEIGKMELMSDKFRRVIREVLSARTPLIATIALKGGGIISEIKNWSDVRIYEMNLANREGLLQEILGQVR